MPRKSAEFRRRSAAAKKGWITRRKHIQEKKENWLKLQMKVESIESILNFIDRAEIPDERVAGVETLVNRHYGEKGYEFDRQGPILKISISTTKTRKTFSVRQ